MAKPLCLLWGQSHWTALICKDNCGLIKLLAIFLIGSNSTVLTKLIAEISEHSDMIEEKSDGQHKHSDY